MSGGKLTPEMIAGAVIPPGQTTRKLFDGHGLYLFLSKAGARQWRLKYGPNGGDRTKTFGEYPAVSIDAARSAVAAFRTTLAAPKPPPTVLAAPELSAAVPQGPVTFGQVGEHWLTFDDGKAQSERTLYKRRLYFGYLAALHALPVASITPAQVRQALESVCAANGRSTAHRVKTYACNIFDHAQRFDVFHNPAARSKGWLPAVKETHHESIVEHGGADAFGLLMERVDTWQSIFGPSVSNAVRFQARTFMRSSEVAHARWSEFKDLDKPELARWEIPGERMKAKRAHIVPLSRQAAAILEEQRRTRPQSPYCFPHRDRDGSPMSTDNLNRVFQFLGYAPKPGETGKVLHTAHGWRTAFSTLARESWGRAENRAPGDDALVEMCQAHADRNKVRAAYNRAERLEERRALIQWWADEIERLKAGYAVAA